jgi:tyrosyl-tRNA synthetase
MPQLPVPAARSESRAPLLEFRDAEALMMHFKSPCRSYWGMAPVAPAHIGLDPLIVAQKDLVQRGFEHTLLLADYHAFISHGLSKDEGRRRADYYQAFFALGCGLTARTVIGSEIQGESRYFQTLLEATQVTSLTDLRESLPSAVSKELRQGSASVSSLLYPLMQCLDALALGVDLIVADESQRKLYRLLEGRGKGIGCGNWPSLSRGAELSSPGALYLVEAACDITGGPLRHSTRKTRICFHDSPLVIAEKIRSMYAPPAGQPLAAHRCHALHETFRHSVFPWAEQPLRFDAEDGPVSIADYDTYHALYEAGRLRPETCKGVLTDFLVQRCRKVNDRIPSALMRWLDTSRLWGN